MSKPRVLACVFRVLLTAVSIGGSVLTPAVPVLAQPEEVLTNEMVIKMVKAKLPDSVIIGKIQASKSSFDVATNALIALKQAGVPDKVMEAMLAAQKPVVSAPPPPQPPIAAAPGPPASPPAPQRVPPGPVQPGPPVPHKTAPTPYDQMAKERPPIYQVLAGKYVELEATIGEIQTNHAFLNQKVEFVLGGAKAGYRIADRQPTFFSYYTSAEAPLVRLKPGENDRNLKIGSGFIFGPYGGTTRRGVRAEDKVDVQSERDASGYYRITPRQPLPPGEYGFVLTQEIAGAASGKIWDFGVE